MKVLVMKSYVITLLQSLGFPILVLLLIVAHGAQTPCLAGACRRPSPIEETNSDILHVRIERLIDTGEPEKDKPIVFEAQVLEVLRGDKKSYPPRISVARASRRLAGYCQRPVYNITRVPKPGEQCISAFTGTTGSIYNETAGGYIYTPELFNHVKARLKELSSVNSNVK